MDPFTRFRVLATVILLVPFSTGDVQGAAALRLAPGTDASDFIIAPDGSQVVFESYNGNANVLFSARTDAGGPPILLSPDDIGSSSLFNARITPDSSRVVFTSNESPGGTWNVATYSSRLDGIGGPALLNRSPIYDDDSSQYNVAISPDSQHVVVRADQGDYSFDLLSKTIDGTGAATSLNGPHDGRFGVGVAYDWRTAGNRVVYQLRDQDGNTNLLSREFDAGAPAVQLTPPNERLAAFDVSRDGSRVVLATVPGPGSGMSLYSRETAGGDFRKLIALDEANPQSFNTLLLSPNGQRLVFTYNARLATIPTNGSGPAKALGPFADGFELDPALSPDGTRVAYLARPEGSGPLELFISPIDASTGATKLNLPLPAGSNINYFQFAPDGRHLIFFGDLIHPGVSDMYSVLADGSAAPVHLGLAAGFAVTADGNTVITGLPQDNLSLAALEAIPIDGGEATQLIQSPLSGGIYRWALLPDESRLVFTSMDGNSSELFSVAIPEPAAWGFAVLSFALLRWRAPSRSATRNGRGPAAG